VALEPSPIWELVDRAVCHKWSVPEFQRGFVWKPTQVRTLAESLGLDFPVGSFLLCNSETLGNRAVSYEDKGSHFRS
jgi:uncharacterized protein with ParB-like and HNH nuclease domain